MSLHSGPSMKSRANPRKILHWDPFFPVFVDNTDTPGCTETPSRTSQGTFFTGDAAKLPLVESVEKRIDWLINHPALVKGKLKLERTEALQVRAVHPAFVRTKEKEIEYLRRQ
eukprot:1144581-Pelagomonas_calceolata.AAC.10